MRSNLILLAALLAPFAYGQSGDVPAIAGYYQCKGQMGGAVGNIKIDYQSDEGERFFNIDWSRLIMKADLPEKVTCRNGHETHLDPDSGAEIFSSDTSCSSATGLEETDDFQLNDHKISHIRIVPTSNTTIDVRVSLKRHGSLFHEYNWHLSCAYELIPGGGGMGL